MRQQPISDIENEFAIQNVNIKYVPSNIEMRCGFWRSIGTSGNKFAIESFMDEIAQTSKANPIELIAKLLTHNIRALHELEEMRLQSNWGGEGVLKKGNLQGFADVDSLNCIQA